MCKYDYNRQKSIEEIILGLAYILVPQVDGVQTEGRQPDRYYKNTGKEKNGVSEPFGAISQGLTFILLLHISLSETDYTQARLSGLGDSALHWILDVKPDIIGLEPLLPP